MGWEVPAPRDEFCRHLDEAVNFMAWASRALRLAGAFAPTCRVRRALRRNRLLLDAIRRDKARLARRLCRGC